MSLLGEIIAFIVQLLEFRKKGFLMDIVLRKIEAIKSGRRLYSFLVNRVKLSRDVSRRVTKIVRSLIFSKELLQRKALGKELNNRKASFEVSPSDGFALFNALDLPDGKEFLHDCLKIVECSNVEEMFQQNKRFGKGKPWRTNVISTDDFIKFPSILNFVTSDEIIGPVSQYLGTLPKIGDIQIWVTKENEEAEASQLYHIDQEDYSQAKLFVHLSDVKFENGPFTFLKASNSERAKNISNEPFSRQSDEFIQSMANKDGIIELIGSKGSSAIVDTSRCYHYGSRTRKGYRIVLVTNFIRFNCIREPNVTVLNSESREKIRKHFNIQDEKLNKLL